MIGSGLELTRTTHASLKDLCTCRYNTGRPAASGQIVTMRLELRFLEDVTLHSLLMTGSGIA